MTVEPSEVAQRLRDSIAALDVWLDGRWIVPVDAVREAATLAADLLDSMEQEGPQRDVRSAFLHSVGAGGVSAADVHDAMSEQGVTEAESKRVMYQLLSEGTLTVGRDLELHPAPTKEAAP